MQNVLKHPNWEADFNKVVFSKYLAMDFPKIWGNIKSILEEQQINYSLNKTFPDIWLRDYFPLSIDGNLWSFAYNPSYMQKEPVLKQIQRAKNKTRIKTTIQSPLVLDGGNCIWNNKYAVFCKRVFKENTSFKKEEIKRELQLVFKNRKLVFIPDLPGDEFGHVDGLVRFVDEQTVIIQDMKTSYSQKLKQTLQNNGVEVLTIPFYDYYKHSGDSLSARGFYLNYLRVGKTIIVPAFGIQEDEKVKDQFKELFPKLNIYQINCNKIADLGGILNCVSWTCE